MSSPMRVGGEVMRGCGGTRFWNEFVKPAREESMFWHWMWLECKKHNAGAVYDCMRHTRMAYHSAIRRTRQIEKDIRKEKVA